MGRGAVAIEHLLGRKLPFDTNLNTRTRDPHALAIELAGISLIAQANPEGALLLGIQIEHF